MFARGGGGQEGRGGGVGVNLIKDGLQTMVDFFDDLQHAILVPPLSVVVTYYTVPLSG